MAYLQKINTLTLYWRHCSAYEWGWRPCNCSRPSFQNLMGGQCWTLVTITTCKLLTGGLFYSIPWPPSPFSLPTIISRSVLFTFNHDLYHCTNCFPRSWTNTVSFSRAVSASSRDSGSLAAALLYMSPGWNWFLIPSIPAATVAARIKYGLAAALGKRFSIQVPYTWKWKIQVGWLHVYYAW